ncbi:unnamed protein product [Caenorhabditis brenneri]
MLHEDYTIFVIAFVPSLIAAISLLICVIKLDRWVELRASKHGQNETTSQQRAQLLRRTPAIFLSVRIGCFHCYQHLCPRILVKSMTSATNSDGSPLDERELRVAAPPAAQN